MKKFGILLLISLLLSVAESSAATAVGNYRGMLGTYGRRITEFPFYMLSTPDGSNVWDESVAAKLNGKWDMNKKPQEFSAQGSFHLSRKTKLKIEAGRAVTVTINGKGYELNNYQKRNGAEIELPSGLHVIKISVANNGGQLKQCGVWITEAANGAEVPIFITKAEMNEFVRKYNKEAIEVSDWDVKKAEIKPKP